MGELQVSKTLQGLSQGNSQYAQFRNGPLYHITSTVENVNGKGSLHMQVAYLVVLNQPCDVGCERILVDIRSIPWTIWGGYFYNNCWAQWVCLHPYSSHKNVWFSMQQELPTCMDLVQQQMCLYTMIYIVPSSSRSIGSIILVLYSFAMHHNNYNNSTQ